MKGQRFISKEPREREKVLLRRRDSYCRHRSHLARVIGAMITRFLSS